MRSWRPFDPLDILFSIVGSILGLLLYNWCKKYMERKRERLRHEDMSSKGPSHDKLQG